MNETIINGIIEESQEMHGFIRYAKGVPGADGVGIRDIQKTSTSGKVDTYTITLTDNTTKTFTVTNGNDGENGISVTGAYINTSGHLIITLSNSTTVDAGVFNGVEMITNKSTSLSSSSTDTEYPSAKAAFECSQSEAYYAISEFEALLENGTVKPRDSVNADFANMATYDANGDDLMETREIAMGAQQALSVSNYSTLVTLLNLADPEEYNKNQSFYVVTVEVPDIWLSSNNEETNIPYTYTTDQQLIQDVIDNDGELQVGYYKISFLETGKVDLSNYYTKAQTYSKSEADTLFSEKQDKLTIVKDTTSTSITLEAVVNTNYIYGELTAFNLSFADGTDDNDEIEIMFKSGATPTTLTVSGTNKVHDSFAPSANAYVEINAKWYIDKWVVLFNEVKQ